VLSKFKEDEMNFESLTSRYMLFWLVVLSGKFSFAYFLQVSEIYVTPALILMEVS